MTYPYTVLFMDAEPGHLAYTWTAEPDSDFGWYGDPEYFEEIDEPITTTRQLWRLVSTDRVTFHPAHELCPTCHGDPELCQVAWHPAHPDYDVTPPDDRFSPVRTEGYDGCDCEGDGRHPLAGQMEVLSTTEGDTP